MIDPLISVLPLKELPSAIKQYFLVIPKALTKDEIASRDANILRVVNIVARRMDIPLNQKLELVSLLLNGCCNDSYSGKKIEKFYNRLGNAASLLNTIQKIYFAESIVDQKREHRGQGAIYLHDERPQKENISPLSKRANSPAGSNNSTQPKKRRKLATINTNINLKCTEKDVD